MTQVIWVDSRMHVSGSDSDFEVSLRESVHLSDARVRIDKLSFADSFLTTDAGQNIFSWRLMAAFRQFPFRRALTQVSAWLVVFRA